MENDATMKQSTDVDDAPVPPDAQPTDHPRAPNTDLQRFYLQSILDESVATVSVDSMRLRLTSVLKPNVPETEMISESTIRYRLGNAMVTAAKLGLLEMMQVLYDELIRRGVTCGIAYWLDSCMEQACSLKRVDIIEWLQTKLKSAKNTQCSCVNEKAYCKTHCADENFRSDCYSGEILSKWSAIELERAFSMGIVRRDFFSIKVFNIICQRVFVRDYEAATAILQFYNRNLLDLMPHILLYLRDPREFDAVALWYRVEAVAKYVDIIKDNHIIIDVGFLFPMLLGALENPRRQCAADKLWELHGYMPDDFLNTNGNYTDHVFSLMFRTLGEDKEKDGTEIKWKLECDKRRITWIAEKLDFAAHPQAAQRFLKASIVYLHVIAQENHENINSTINCVRTFARDNGIPHVAIDSNCTESLPSKVWFNPAFNIVVSMMSDI